MSISSLPGRSADPTAHWHRGLVYGSAEEFVAAAVPYLKAGTAVGASVLAVTSRTNADLLRTKLVEIDQIQFVDSAEWYTTPARTMVAYDDYVSARQRSANGPIWILGEPVWRDLSAEDQVAWHRYESLLNLALADRGVNLVCPYDASMLDQAILELARSTHPAILASGAEAVSERYLDPVEFLAECDQAPLAPAPSGAVITTLEFTASDLATLRRLIAQRAEDHGMSADQISDVVLAANEVATNAIQHGHGDAALSLWRNGDHLVIEISDQGPGPHDPLAGQLRPRETDASESGWGLWISRQLCHRVELRSAPGWVVRLYTRLDP